MEAKGRRLNRRALAAVIITTCLSGVAVVDVGSVFVSRTFENSSLRPAEVTAALAASSFECSEGYNTGPDEQGLWFCFRESFSESADVGIAPWPNSSLSYLVARVRTSGESARQLREDAVGIFQQIVTTVVPGSSAGSARLWVSRSVASTDAEAWFGGTTLDLHHSSGDSSPEYQLEASLGEPWPGDNPSGDDYRTLVHPIFGITEPVVERYLDTLGAQCHQENDTNYRCGAQGTARPAYDGAIQGGGPAMVVDRFRIDVLSQPDDLTQTALRVLSDGAVMADPASWAAIGVQWIRRHLDGQYHNIVLDMDRFRLIPNRQGVLPSHGGGISLEVIAWPAWSSSECLCGDRPFPSTPVP